MRNTPLNPEILISAIAVCADSDFAELAAASSADYDRADGGRWAILTSDSQNEARAPGGARVWIDVGAGGTETRCAADDCCTVSSYVARDFR